jgi:hypothetical protein
MTRKEFVSVRVLSVIFGMVCGGATWYGLADILPPSTTELAAALTFVVTTLLSTIAEGVMMSAEYNREIRNLLLSRNQ